MSKRPKRSRTPERPGDSATPGAPTAPAAPAAPRRGRAWALAAVALAAIAIGWIAYRSASPATDRAPPLGATREASPAAGPERPATGPGKSAWRVERAAAPGATDFPAIPPSEVFTLRVEDVFGGPIGGAEIRIRDAPVATTDASGVAKLRPRALWPDSSGWLEIRAPGYATDGAGYDVPGEATVRMIPGGAVSGRVVKKSDGSPVPGLVVSAASSNSTSDREGRFTLEGLRPSALRPLARGRGFFGQGERDVDVGLGARVTDVVIPVGPAFAVRGRIRAGGPLHAGLEVEACGVTGPVDTGGRFELSGIPPGRCEITVSGGEDGFESVGGSASVAIVDRDVEKDVDLGPRHDAVAEVVDRRGVPLADHRVDAHHGAGRAVRSAGCRTGADGRCRIHGVPPGRIEMFADDSDDKRTVEVPAAGPARFVSHATARIEGKLTCLHGQPARRRGVHAYVKDGVTHAAMTRKDGSFVLDRMPPGDYTVSFYDPATKVPEQELGVKLAEAEVRHLDLHLPDETGEIRGRVLLPDGSPAADALVSYRSAVFETQWGGVIPLGDEAAVTGADGGFSFRGLPPKRGYQVVAYLPTGERASIGGPLAEGKPVTIKFGATPSAR